MPAVRISSPSPFPTACAPWIIRNRISRVQSASNVNCSSGARRMPVNRSLDSEACAKRRISFSPRSGFCSPMLWMSSKANVAIMVLSADAAMSAVRVPPENMAISPRRSPAFTTATRFFFSPPLLPFRQTRARPRSRA